MRDCFTCGTLLRVRWQSNAGSVHRREVRSIVTVLDTETRLKIGKRQSGQPPEDGKAIEKASERARPRNTEEHLVVSCISLSRASKSWSRIGSISLWLRGSHHRYTFKVSICQRWLRYRNLT